METLKLRSPITINGKTVNKIELDFDALTVRDFALAESRCVKDANFTACETDYAFHIYIACYAAIAANKSYSIEDMERVKGFDARELMRLGRNFILSSWEDSDQESSGDACANTQEPTSPVI